MEYYTVIIMNKVDLYAMIGKESEKRVRCESVYNTIFFQLKVNILIYI